MDMPTLRSKTQRCAQHIDGSTMESTERKDFVREKKITKMGAKRSYKFMSGKVYVVEMLTTWN
jgi:hypothetical protein